MRPREITDSIIRARYRKLGIPGVCYYCGMPADCRDHVPPLAYAEMEVELERDPGPHWLVVACRECNGALGAYPGVLFSSRRAHLLRYYRGKYRKELSIPHWTPGELASMGKNMRSKIMAGLKVRRAVEEMLSVLERPVPEPVYERPTVREAENDQPSRFS